MKIGARSRQRKLDAMVAHHPAKDHPWFLDLVHVIAESQPNGSAETIFQCAHFCWQMSETVRASQSERDRATITAERQRILAIVNHGLDVGDVQSAFSLALTSDLSAADAIEVINANRGDIVRPS